MMAQKLMIPDTAFRLSSGKKRPREQSKAHLAFVRGLLCCVPGCGSRRNVEAAHIRSGCPQFGKPITGAGEKPSDCWTIPLCAYHHRLGPKAVHVIGEERFFVFHKLSPFVLALALWRATGDDAAAELIISELRRAP